MDIELEVELKDGVAKVFADVSISRDREDWEVNELDIRGWDHDKNVETKIDSDSISHEDRTKIICAIDKYIMENYEGDEGEDPSDVYHRHRDA